MLPIAVKASGMVTSVGFNAHSSLDAMWAGISGLKVANLWDWESGEYLQAGKVVLPQWWEGLGKLVDLVSPAIYECLDAANPTPPEEIPIFLGVASKDRPFRLEGLDNLLNEVEYKLNIKHHPASKIIPMGQVSCVIGIQEVASYFGSSQAHYCIIAGVDSFLQQDVVEEYMDQRRIMTADNSNGFFPGEAGSAILVTRASENLTSDILIQGIGLAEELATIQSEEPLRGDGLTESISQALDDAKTSIYEIRYRITDLNGEHYKFKEASFALTRFMHKPVKWMMDLWHPIEYIGDIGSAIGPLVLATALHANKKGYAPSRKALCHFSNDDGFRGAIVVDSGGD